jgi:hypothetical protein
MYLDDPSRSQVQQKKWRRWRLLGLKATKGRCLLGLTISTRQRNSLEGHSPTLPHAATRHRRGCSNMGYPCFGFRTTPGCIAPSGDRTCTDKLDRSVVRTQRQRTGTFSTIHKPQDSPTPLCPWASSWWREIMHALSSSLACSLFEGFLS